MAVGTMSWLKLGRIFDPMELSNRGLSAALMPIAEILDEENDIIRVYFAPRDTQNRSEFHYFDLSIKDPSRILSISKEPLLTHGKLGTFDDSGITPGSIMKFNGRTFYYYTGWNLTHTVPFNNSIGIAELDRNARIGDGPILTRTLHEPYSCASPFVLKEGGLFRMWYASMDRWESQPDGPKHYYDIKYAESDDGLNWRRSGQGVITYANKDEYAFGRPFVLKDHDLYKMWYSYRGANYRIGYAESSDGIQWERKDANAGVEVSDSGWDSEMIEYPFILPYKGDLFMFYNGNGYGKTGIGLARKIGQ
jgi:hypothetical protein